MAVQRRVAEPPAPPGPAPERAGLLFWFSWVSRAIRILDRINKKLKNPEEKYIDTKSFNIDKEKVKEILTKNVAIRLRW